MTHRGLASSCFTGTLALLLTMPAVALAQTQEPPAREPARNADFRFGRPKAAISVRGGWNIASAGSDLFDFVTNQLTVEKDDFSSPGIGSDVNFTLTPRMEVGGGFFFAKASQASEYRDFVDNEFLPITQSTSLKTWQFTGSVRYALLPRGREISRFAWVPNRFIPFVGAGGGVVYYEFRQSGDFVDFQDLSVFTDVFRSSGWAPSGHVFGGVDIQLYRGLYASVEGRYTKASAELSRDFVDFDPIDLSGFRMLGGINYVF